MAVGEKTVSVRAGSSPAYPDIHMEASVSENVTASPGSYPEPSMNVAEISLTGLGTRTSDRKRPRSLLYRRRRILVASDVLALLLSFTFAILISREMTDRGFSAVTIYSFAAMVPVWIFVAYSAGLFHQEDRRIDVGFVDEAGKVIVTATAWIWLLVVVRSLFASGATDLLLPGLIWVFMISFLLTFRSAVRAFIRARPWNLQPVTLIGEKPDVDALSRRIARHPEWSLAVTLVVLIDSESVYQLWDQSGITSTRGPSGLRPCSVTSERTLAKLLREMAVRRVMVAGGLNSSRAQARLVHHLIDQGVAVDQVAGGPETHYSNAAFQELEGTPVVSIAPAEQNPMDKRMKRAFDVLVSSSLLLFLVPLFIWVALRIKLDSPGPVLFRQPRAGLGGEPFNLIKFRTMVDGAHRQRAQLRRKTRKAGNDGILFKLADDPRITRFGSKIRKSSVDELPQLLNVLKGEMSIVGPRPLVMEEAQEAKDLYAARVNVRPGIAGPWQALGRSSIPFEDMVRLDYSYVVSWSMANDLKLLIRTTNSVLQRHGAL